MFTVGDTIVSKDDRLRATTYTVIATTTGDIVYAKPSGGNYIRALLATDYVKLEADHAPSAVPVLRV